MNVILLEREATAYKLPASDKRFAHVRGVLRMRLGDTFLVGVANGPLGTATVTALSAEDLAFSVEWGGRPALPPPVTLILGMCRPAAARRILHTLPTLGIQRLILMEAGRSDPAYGRASLWQSEEWKGHLLEGVEQAFDTYVPEVCICHEWAVVFERIKPEGLRVALDVYSPEGWTALPSSPLEHAVLAIGPERGWNKNDREALQGAGFTFTRLFGGRVMRCETAVTAGLALLHEKAGWLDMAPHWRVPGGDDI